MKQLAAILLRNPRKTDRDKLCRIAGSRPLWRRGLAAFAVLLFTISALAQNKKAPAKPSALDLYVEQALRGTKVVDESSPGSLFTNAGSLADGFRDLRASRVYDLVTVVVSDTTSAVSTGASNTSRKSSVASSITALAGITAATGPLANLATTANNQQLQGQGTTSRGTTLTATVTAQVTQVLPNGNLVIQGQKEINVNSEHQTITLRGIVRPADLSSLNQIPSDRIAMLDVRVTGKGIVNDSIKRPFILYRLLLGLLPF
ncbi:MAG: flagellar basal body L-ring protein FlgH [Bryobacteraceae bacterium]|jgi:flagellar L-ring protein precursor FlgH